MIFEYSHAYSHNSHLYFQSIHLHSFSGLSELVLFTREDELMYLEFITDVTNEILMQGLYSDRCGETLFCRREIARHLFHFLFVLTYLMKYLSVQGTEESIWTSHWYEQTID